MEKPSIGGYVRSSAVFHRIMLGNPKEKQHGGSGHRNYPNPLLIPQEDAPCHLDPKLRNRGKTDEAWKGMRL